MIRASRWGRATLFVRDNRDGSVRNFRARGTVRWTPDSRFLVFENDTSGAETTHVHAIDADSGSERDLTPYPGVRAGLHRMPLNTPGETWVTTVVKS